MIKNERQLRITKSQLENFKQYLSLLERKKEHGTNQTLRNAEENAIRNQINDLENQIREYESLWASKTNIPELHSFAEIPSALIKARISQGLSQRELAERVGLKEQQIQRYESTEYETASITRVGQVINALSLKVPGSFEIPPGNITFADLFKKMRNVGLENEFIVNRLLPTQVAAELRERDRDKRIDELGIKVAEQVGRIYGWTPRQMFGTEPLQMNSESLGNVQFKLRKGVNQSRLTAYAFYARYLALLILHAIERLPIRRLPTDPYEIHNSVLLTDQTITLEKALRYVWNLGVPVLPLRDPGSFQGAHFREGRRSIIILKDPTDSPARWLFDLFHELSHATQHQDDTEQRALIMEDFEKLSSKGNRNEEDLEANRFAGAVLLGQSPNKLVKMCIAEAQHDLPKLKQAVQHVARRENVRADVLANCVAFRLSEQGDNWWGPARKLQETYHDIQRIAADVLLDFVDLTRLSEPDLGILRKGLDLVEVKQYE